MKYSLIVTGWNCEKYIAKCFASIKNQTDKDFEIIIVDDGSTDNTSIEINKTGLKHHCFNINIGTYYARDFAINKSSGDIIIMMDMDDYILPNAIEMIKKQYSQNENILMTYGNYQYLNGIKCPVSMDFSEAINEAADYRKDIWRCTHLRSFSKKMYDLIPSWNLTKAEVNSYPDVEILFSMMEMSGKNRIGIIYEPIYVYNTNNPEATLKRFGKDNPGYYEIINREKRLFLPQNFKR